MNSEELEALGVRVREALKATGQRSFARQLPDRSSLALLGSVCRDLRAFVEVEPGSADGWRLLALAEEALLHWGAAREALERAVALAPNRKDQKRLALLRTAEAKRSSVGLSPVHQADLATALAKRLADCKHEGTPLVEAWLTARGLRLTPEQVRALADDDACPCDCGILSKLERDLGRR